MDFPPSQPEAASPTPPPAVTLNGPITDASEEPMGPAADLGQKVQVDPVKIPLEKLTKEEPESKSISFKTSSFLKDHVKVPTTEPSAQAPSSSGSEFAGKSTDELRQQMVNEEMQPIDEMAPEDFEMIAGFLIDAWDLGTVTLFRIYALDTSDAPYEMTSSKKGKLKKLLTLILIRFNKKFPLGVLFFMTLILTHITPTLKAHEHRKLVQETRKKKPAKKPKAEKQKPGPKPKPKAPADATQAAEGSGDGGGITSPDIPKKKPGGQGK